MAAAAPPRDVRATVRYCRAVLATGTPELTPASREEEFAETRVVTLLDARTALPGGIGSWDLDTHGFMVHAPPPADGVDFSDHQRTREEYGPRLVELAKQLTNAKNGFFYQYLTRGKDGGMFKLPANYCHSDFGPNSVPRMRRELTERFGLPQQEAEDCDLCILNMWTPVGRPAYKDPLCLLDFSSMGGYEEESVPLPFNVVQTFFRPRFAEVLRGREGGNQFSDDAARSDIKHSFGTKTEGSYLTAPIYSPTHRWVFCSDMCPDEAWWFKQYDTRPGVATCSFHSSFADPFHFDDPSKPERLSAEFRVLLTFPKPSAASKL